jgi:hypothetical protein
VLDADLPELAWAITAVVRKGAVVQTQTPKNVRYVRVLCGVGPDVAIRVEDWAKIQPLILDGTFDPLALPVEAGFRDFDPATRFDPSTLKQNDPLYDRVLFYLSELFPETVPTAGGC